jgi:hypothetical protein
LSSATIADKNVARQGRHVLLRSAVKEEAERERKQHLRGLKPSGEMAEVAEGCSQRAQPAESFFVWRAGAPGSRRLVGTRAPPHFPVARLPAPASASRCPRHFAVVVVAFESVFLEKQFYKGKSKEEEGEEEVIMSSTSSYSRDPELATAAAAAATERTPLKQQRQPADCGGSKRVALEGDRSESSRASRAGHLARQLSTRLRTIIVEHTGTCVRASRIV